MSAWAALALMIVAVLIWLGVSAVFLLRGIGKLKRHIEELKKGPIFIAAARAPGDLARLNRAAEQLPVQIEALKAAAAELRLSVVQFKGLSFAPGVRSVTEGYTGLIELLR